MTPLERDESCGASGHATARLIARTAVRLFAERGFEATPVRAIVEAAGVTCPTLYYHFKSKEGLAQALVIGPLTAVVDGLRTLLDDSGLGPIDRLERMVDVVLNFSREDPDRARLVYAVMFGPSDRALADEAEGIIRRLDASLVEAASRMVEAGFLPEGRSADLARALRGQTVIHTMDFLYRDGNLGDALARRIVADLLLGFAEPAARESFPKRDARPPEATPDD